VRYAASLITLFTDLVLSAFAVIGHFDCLGIFEKVEIEMKNGLQH